ncbi:sperm-associated antigen 8 isoform X1 [Ranitomeya variabilis]|uniref:sperm-associated antigen 8 isoform X1 n=2 Tax=Ranitomeya variabilis TaxID=490064 RepID=UPI004055FF82
MEQPRVPRSLGLQEERATASLDAIHSAPGHAMEGEVHRHGHKGILSTQLLVDMSTTHQESYRKPESDYGRQRTGLKEEKIRKLLYHKFSQEILEELRSPLEETSVTESSSKRDYQVEGFLPKIPTPSKEYDYQMDQAKTFWMENANRITGVSDIRTRNSPFKRSSAFSTPISHYLDQSVPHSIENYPNM